MEPVTTYAAPMVKAAAADDSIAGVEGLRAFLAAQAKDPAKGVNLQGDPVHPGAPGQLMRRGIFKEAVKIGSTVVVEGYRAKDGSNNGSSGRVTFADGRQVFTAAAEDKTPEEKK